jgi:ferredoxin
MDITIYVQDESGLRTPVQVPTDMNMNLMEVLKSHEYPIEAICGGMALCATCHLEIVEGDLGTRTNAEVEMLDTLFNTVENSRLACQIRPNASHEGMVIRLLGEN